MENLYMIVDSTTGEFLCEDGSLFWGIEEAEVFFSLEEAQKIVATLDDPENYKIIIGGKENV